MLFLVLGKDGKLPASLDGKPWCDLLRRQVRFWARLDRDKVLCAVEIDVLCDRFLAQDLTSGTQEEKYLKTFAANESQFLEIALVKKSEAEAMPEGYPSVLIENIDFRF